MAMATWSWNWSRAGPWPANYKPVARPRFWHEVTLHHIYGKLGQSLLEWPEWRSFVAGLHPQLLRLAGLSRRQLLDDPSLLRQLSRAIAAEQTQRLTAGVSWGERDLVDPLPRVQRRQQQVADKTRTLKRALAERERRVEELFPELRGLRRVSGGRRG